MLHGTNRETICLSALWRTSHHPNSIISPTESAKANEASYSGRRTPGLCSISGASTWAAVTRPKDSSLTELHHPNIAELLHLLQLVITIVQLLGPDMTLLIGRRHDSPAVRMSELVDNYPGLPPPRRHLIRFLCKSSACETAMCCKKPRQGTCCADIAKISLSSCAIGSFTAPEHGHDAYPCPREDAGNQIYPCCHEGRRRGASATVYEHLS